MARTDASSDGRSRIVAVLGPTNTGKTHLAMERMLGHASGMIGFPLRLLARQGTPAPTMTFARLLDCAHDAVASPLFALGYGLEASEAGVRLHPAPRGRRAWPRRREGGRKSSPESQSPFAALEALRSAR